MHGRQKVFYTLTSLLPQVLMKVKRLLGKLQKK